jgi:hypothetical protein
MSDFAYSNYEDIKKQLRLPDDSLKEELLLYQQGVDDYINNKLRQRLGEFDSNGERIILPLTFETRPELDEELMQIAVDLIEGKFRLKTSEKPLNWDTAVKTFEAYLDRRFGLVTHKPYEQPITLEVTPRSGTTGTLVTLGGKNWSRFNQLKFYFDEFEVATTPATVLTNQVGDFSNVTFNVPTSAVVGSHKIKATDKLRGLELRFAVV